MPQQLPVNNDEWVDDDPNWQDDVEAPSLWQRANTPLITAPSDIARNVGDRMTEHSLDESMFGSQLRGFGAGALQGVGDLISGMTSTAGLATTLLTMGEGTAAKAGLSSIAKALGYGARGAGAAYAAHGAGETATGVMEGDLQKAGQGIFEMAGGGLGMRGVTPKGGKIPKLTSDTLIDDINKMPGVKRPNAANFTPDEFSQLNDFMGNGADEAEIASIREGATKPSKTPIKTAIETAKTNADGWVDDAKPNQPTTGPRKLGEGIYDPHATYREVPVGTTYHVSPKDMPRKKLNEAVKLGFDYQGMDEKGRIIIKKIK